MNNYHPLLLQILQKRGWDSNNLHHFFSTNLRDLPSFDMHDLNKAALKIIQGLKENKKIGVYGDYDVDGTTSCALLFHFFKLFNVEIATYQPSRFVEGYGIHPSSIDQALEDGIDILISVDCGISNVETAEYALEKNLCLIITDHHKDAKETLPPAYAVVNPNRRDEPKDSPLYCLAGVGVAFALALEIKKEWEKENSALPSIYSLLQLVAIGTISDLAKLDPVNLKMVRHGLKQLLTSENEGIRCCFTPQEREVGKVGSEKISFFIGPLINSKGRLDHPDYALKLLTADNHQDAFHYFENLQNSNNQRKSIQNEVYQEALEQIKGTWNEQQTISIAYAPHWHEGVIGIVASKLVETFKIPAIVFTDSSDPGIIKASARSAGELNLFEQLDEVKELFIKFGGHKAAAGLSMKKQNLLILKKVLHANLLKVPAIVRTNQINYDLEINFEDIDYDFVKSLEKLEPFGMGNPKPLFKLRGLKLESFQLLKDVHVKWTFSKPGVRQKLQGISFYYMGKWEALMPEDIFDQQQDNLSIICEIGINHFNNREYIQLMVKELSFE